MGIRVRYMLLRYLAFLLLTDFFPLGGGGNDRIVVVCHEITFCGGEVKQETGGNQEVTET